MEPQSELNRGCRNGKLNWQQFSKTQMEPQSECNAVQRSRLLPRWAAAFSSVAFLRAGAPFHPGLHSRDSSLITMFV